MKKKITKKWALVWCFLFIPLFVPKSLLALTLESYSFESFSVLNPSFSSSTSAQVNMNGDDLSGSKVVLLAFKYGFLGAGSGIVLRSLEGNLSDDSAIQARILGQPLFYPNPFSVSAGSELGYKLSKNMDVEVRIYDIRANEIFRGSYTAGTHGGLTGYNKVRFDLATLGRYELSAGIYFFVLMHDGKVLGRGKFAVRP